MTGNLPFEYADGLAPIDSPATAVARVPAGLSGRDELLRALSQVLQLPTYFGFNWDALSDCLSDLHWMEDHTVVLVHTDLPDLPPADRDIYIAVLADAVRSWSPGDRHRLRVLFPAAHRDELEADRS
jgi:RNAse (barnase) inhibitor barstar